MVFTTSKTLKTAKKIKVELYKVFSNDLPLYLTLLAQTFTPSHSFQWLQVIIFLQCSINFEQFES